MIIQRHSTISPKLICPFLNNDIGNFIHFFSWFLTRTKKSKKRKIVLLKDHFFSSSEISIGYIYLHFSLWISLSQITLNHLSPTFFLQLLFSHQHAHNRPDLRDIENSLSDGIATAKYLVLVTWYLVEKKENSCIFSMFLT